MLLRAVMPLLERRAAAAERQAQATEALAHAVRTYLCWHEPAFADLLAGREVPVPEEGPPDEYSEHGAARDLQAERMEQLRAYWFAEHGELLDDERLVAEYTRLYAEASDRVSALDARKDGPGVAH